MERPATAREGVPPRDGARGTDRSRLVSFLQLTKPRITALVAATAAAGYLVAAGEFSATVLAALVTGTVLSAGGTNALNQWWEREADGRMARTRDRPLPSGELAPLAALAFGVGTAAAGTAVLAAGTTILTAALAAATVVIYVTVYTPLKRHTPACTYVGAVPGALPILGGWAAAGDGIGPAGWALFALLALWQLPHFFALEWLAREDYRRAGFATLAVRDPDGGRSARHAVATTLALAPASLAALVDPGLGVLYGAAAGLGLVSLMVPACGFLLDRSRRWARRLFAASLVYLPAVMAAAVLDALAVTG